MKAKIKQYIPADRTFGNEIEIDLPYYSENTWGNKGISKIFQGNDGEIVCLKIFQNNLNDENSYSIGYYEKEYSVGGNNVKSDLEKWEEYKNKLIKYIESI